MRRIILPLPVVISTIHMVKFIYHSMFIYYFKPKLMKSRFLIDIDLMKSLPFRCCACFGIINRIGQFDIRRAGFIRMSLDKKLHPIKKTKN